MKNYDFWNKFVKTGKIDDYLHYIACTQEEAMDGFLPGIESAMQHLDLEKEGGVSAGINYRDGDGSIGHACW